MLESVRTRGVVHLIHMVLGRVAFCVVCRCNIARETNNCHTAYSVHLDVTRHRTLQPTVQ